MSRHSLFIGLALLLCCSDLGFPLTQCWADKPITIEVFELPDGMTWPSAEEIASEHFETDVMALPILPRRYSREALIVDRQRTFVLRLSTLVRLAPTEQEFLFRAMNQSRLLIDGQVVGSTEFKLKYQDGHNKVPKLTKVAANLRTLAPGHGEQIVSFLPTEESHRIALEVIVGGKQKRPETGELSLSVRPAGDADSPFTVMGQFTNRNLRTNRFELTDHLWQQFLASESDRIVEENRLRRYAADEQKGYWLNRHDLARRFVEENAPTEGSSQTIDSIVRATSHGDSTLPPRVGDYAFLRRLALDTVGVIPTLEEIERYLADPPEVRRSTAIARFLSDNRWADHWVSYWQDVLAENPGILKPKLNNTGPFRWWIYESFVDNKPIDRFVTELIMMRGSKYAGGPAGFSMATQNDAPFAAKAHVLAQAFLGIQMKCARCHDSPQHDLRQEQLFNLAAMLDRKPQTVLETSSIPGSAAELESLIVEVSLKPGTAVPPVWPFDEMAESDLDLKDGILADNGDTRERMAALITYHANQRFARVIANRLWQRYVGRGIVDSVDDWENAVYHSHELLDFLALQLTANGYDLKQLSSLIFNSDTYQSQITNDTRQHPLLPVRRRQSAEQIVDSLFTISGKSFKSEALNLDVDGQRSISTFLNLGVPKRAWEFASLSNERDRPALAMPRAQSVVDLLLTFGWRDSRQDPLTVRESEATVQQPGIVANGVVAQRSVCLSDDNRLTELCRSANSVAQVTDYLYLQILSRPPRDDEKGFVAALLSDGFDQRITSEPPELVASKRHAVSWSNHLNEEATRIKLEVERQVREGDPPTKTLSRDWRERAEDVAWGLINSPEFVFVP